MAASGGSVDLEKLRVVDLKEILSGLSLPTSGNKADLVSRLRRHYDERDAESAESNGAGDADMQVDSVDALHDIDGSGRKEAPEEGHRLISDDTDAGGNGDSRAGAAAVAAAGLNQDAHQETAGGSNPAADSLVDEKPQIVPHSDSVVTQPAEACTLAGEPRTAAASEDATSPASAAVCQPHAPLPSVPPGQHPTPLSPALLMQPPTPLLIAPPLSTPVQMQSPVAPAVQTSQPLAPEGQLQPPPAPPMHMPLPPIMVPGSFPPNIMMQMQPLPAMPVLPHAVPAVPGLQVPPPMSLVTMSQPQSTHVIPMQLPPPPPPPPMVAQAPLGVALPPPPPPMVAQAPLGVALPPPPPPPALQSLAAGQAMHQQPSLATDSPAAAVDWASETSSRLQVARQQQAALDEQEQQQQQMSEQQRLVEEELQLLEDELNESARSQPVQDEQAVEKRRKLVGYFDTLSQQRRVLLELEEQHKRRLRLMDDEVLGKVVAEHDKKQAATASGPPGVRSEEQQRAILFETQRRLVLEQQQLQSAYQQVLDSQRRQYDETVRQLHVLQGRPDPGSAPGGVRLPSALEKALALKYMRERQHGRLDDQVPRGTRGAASSIAEEDAGVTGDSQPLVTSGLVSAGMGGDDEDDEDIVADVDEETAAALDNADEADAGLPSVPKSIKEQKNKRKKKKKKKRSSAASRNRSAKQQQQEAELANEDERADGAEDEPVEIEYVQEPPLVERGNPLYYQFAKIFEAFKISDTDKPKGASGTTKDASHELGIGDKLARMSEMASRDIPMKARGLLIEEDLAEETKEDENDDRPKLSKKKLKKLTRMSVAQLKQIATRPDVVEMQDVTSADPKLLVHLKATRNTVPVPRHWCMKRKYLQGKRGIEKPPFDLPDYIKATGIMEMRQSLADKEQEKSLKQKMREKVRPKMGKIDIDYQKLHDAFFRYQVKPRLTVHGDLYYEGKEFETRLKEKKPGNLSEDLRTALGMPLGESADRFPPPWLIAMQRYGPPPSYPNLKIPGLNAPLPDGCSFGYHAGGWGKPPVDETGRPLYGDVFGTQAVDTTAQSHDEEVDKSHWGELESESSDEESSSEEEDESGDEGGGREEDTSGLVTPADAGLVTPSGLTSGVPAGMETPDMIELRKKRIEDAMEAGGETPALYTILPEKRAAVGAAMMGSAHIYDISAAKKAGPAVVAGSAGSAPSGAEGVEVALNPEELDLDSAAMQAKYDQTLREQRSQLEKEDLSDMVAEHAAKQSKKRKKQQQNEKVATKKHKEFKF